MEVLEQFLVMLGAKVETEKVKAFGAALTKVASIATVVVGALKTVTAATWAFADSYVRKAEELYKSNSGLISVTKEQVEMSKKYQDGMDKLGKTIESVKVRIAFGFLPTMLEMVDSLNAFLAANKDLIVNGITRLLSEISYVSQVVNNTVRFIAKAIEATIGWKGALLVLAAVFAIVKRAMLMAFITNPITWVVAAIVGLMLLIDDFMTYLDGGESQFGEFWGAMLGWIDRAKAHWNSFSDSTKSSIKAILIALTMLTPVLGGLTGMVSLLGKAFLFVGRAMLTTPIGIIVTLVGLLIYAIFDLIKWIKTGESTFSGFWRLVADIWGAIVSTVSQRIELIVNAVNGMISSISAALSGVFDIVTAPFAKAFDWISNKFSSLGGLISGAVSGAGRLFGMGASAAASNTVNNGGNMTVNAPINVTSSDPNKAAKLVKAGVTDTMNTAHRNMGSRVRA